MSEQRGVEIVGWEPSDPYDSLEPGEFFLDDSGELLMCAMAGAIVVAGEDVGLLVDSAVGRRVRVRIEVLGYDTEGS